MKELTTEQKAQRYDEALGRAKGLYAKGAPDSLYLEEIFSELKESEDERIRKNLIELFHDTVSNDEIFSDYGLDKTEVLAWLEKQGEQKPAWSKEDETGLVNAIIMLKEGASLHFVKDDIKKVVDWLKSLKQRIGE